MKTSHTISLLSTIGMISNAKLVPNGRNSTQIDKYCPQLFRGELPHRGSCFALWLVLPLFIQRSKLLIGKMCVCVCVCVSCSIVLCNPMDCSPPGFLVHGISQARILEWVAISFSRRSSPPRDWTWVLQVDSLPSEPPGKPCVCVCVFMKCLPLMSLWGSALQICALFPKLFLKTETWVQHPVPRQSIPFLCLHSPAPDTCSQWSLPPCWRNQHLDSSLPPSSAERQFCSREKPFLTSSLRPPP